MNLFESCLFDLLLHNDCVIVPNFGAFVAQHSSAKIQQNGTISPPSKSFSFNKLLKQNDGLLIDLIARKTGFSYDEAKEIVENQVENWCKILDSGQRTNLDRIGYFVNDTKGNLYFQADTTNFSLNSYGLPVLSFSYIEQLLESSLIKVTEVANRDQIISLNESPIIAFDANIRNVIEEKPERNDLATPTKSSRKFVRYAAAALIGLPIAFYSYWIPTHTAVLQSGIVTLSDFNPFQKLPKQSVKTPNDSENKQDPSAQTVSAADNIDSVVPKVENIELTSETVVVQKPVTVVKIKKGSFHLISGSFNSRENAEKLVQQLKTSGFDTPTITKINTMYRVSAASSLSTEDLLPKSQELSALGIESWILRK